MNSLLLQHGDSFRFKKGAVLWRQDQQAERLVGLCTGTVKLVREWKGGRTPVMDLVFRGGLLGEEAAVTNARSFSTAIALANGKALAIPAARLRRVLVQRPDLSEIVLRAAIERHHVFGRRLDELGNGAVEDRLARVLLRIGDQMGLPDARGIFLPVRLSRGDLAEMVGCRVETAIRVMTRWQREGIVETRREGIILCDQSGLAKASLPAT